ncbi:MAG: hypothetical protein RBQ77_00925 [Candidatus Methanomethylophilaceae archaeon]|nr:hypothetical protein [Candidatus Methanomethylophilaceae archaeon]NLF34274.1 hypothetical protein [Thermoplasmatales archaeon]
MTPPEPMTFEDLTSVYRLEKKAPALSNVRKDLYRSMSNLLATVSKEYERQLARDPDSIICEGVNQRRKKIKLLSMEIVELRMQKVASLALRGARGADNSIDVLTPEEKEYYSEVLAASRKQACILDSLRKGTRYSSPDIDSRPSEEKASPAAPPKMRETPAPTAPATLSEAPGPADMPELEEPDDEPEDFLEEFPDRITGDVVPVAPEPGMTVADDAGPSEEASEDHAAVIRILEDLPRFSGPERDYDLRKEDIVMMPLAMAMALVSREKAVIVRPTP